MTFSPLGAIHDLHLVKLLLLTIQYECLIYLVLPTTHVVHVWDMGRRRHTQWSTPA